MKKIKKILIFSIICFWVMFCSVYASGTGSYSISVGSKSLTTEKTTTLNITANNCAGTFKVSSDNSSVVKVSSSLEWIENGSAKIILTAVGEGKATITVSAFAASFDAPADEPDDIVGQKSVVITVKAKATNTTTPNNSNTSSSNTNTTTTAITTTKSSNAKIKALTVDVEGLAPSFKKDVTSYKLTVGNNINKLKMTMTLDDDGATYRITGNKDFKEGENIVKIIVTAENKTTKTYKITVTKTTDLRLNTLVLANATLINEFDSDVYEYNLRDIESNINKLDINAIPINSNAIVKIAGNDSLTIGENIIKIVVYDKDEKASKVYTLKVNKLEEAIEAISDDAKIIEQNSYAEMLKDKIEIYKDKFGVYGNAIKLNATIILLYLLALIEFAQVIYLYKQLKNIDPSFDKIKIKKKETESKRIKRRKVNIDIDIDDKE